LTTSARSRLMVAACGVVCRTRQMTCGLRAPYAKAVCGRTTGCLNDLDYSPGIHKRPVRHRRHRRPLVSVWLRCGVGPWRTHYVRAGKPIPRK
jgi:hypothetical protein